MIIMDARTGDFTFIGRSSWTLTEAGRKAGITPEHLGIIPMFFRHGDRTPAKEQIAQSYCGGWSPMQPVKWTLDTDTLALSYPGDDPLPALATTKINDERVAFYDHAWVAIVQPDGSFEVDRLD